MRRILVMEDNVECLGYTLYVLPDESTDKAWVEFKDKTAEMHLGIKGAFEDVVGNFTHEWGEMFLYYNDCLFDSRCHSEEHSLHNCRIVLDHVIWQRMNIYLGIRLLRVLPALNQVWAKCNTKRKKAKE